MTVSRETGSAGPHRDRRPEHVPPPPEAREAFGQGFPLAERYARWLAEAGIERGLLGPREVPRLWERHLLNSLVLSPLVPGGAEVADVGSGAGLPGLALALARPDLRVALVEPLLRRTTFLSEVVADLGVGDRVEVVRARAEERHGQAKYDVVVSRAVAPLDRLLRWCVPLCRPSGRVLALKGSSAADEITAASRAVAALGCGAPALVEVPVSWQSRPATVVRVDAAPPRH